MVIGKNRKARKVDNYGHVEGTCDKCGDTDQLLTYYARTGERLCPGDLKLREREVPGRLKEQEETKMSERFQEITSLPDD